MKFLTASKLLVLPFLASINAVQAVEKDHAAAKVKSSSFLKNHRALHQQKLNELKTLVKEKARALEGHLSEETENLLNCYNEVEYPAWPERVTYTGKEKGPLQIDYSQDTTCAEGFKTDIESFLYCDEVRELITEKFCIPDNDVCPDDFSTLLSDLAKALKLEGEIEGSDYYYDYYNYVSKDKCAYPQCFAKATEEFTVTLPEEDYFRAPYSCPEIGGTCEVDCESDEAFICIPDLCYANKDYDADYYNYYYPDAAEADQLPALKKFQRVRGGFGKRNLKAKGTKSPKGTKATKAGKGKCSCKAPRA